MAQALAITLLSLALLGKLVFNFIGSAQSEYRLLALSQMPALHILIGMQHGAVVR